MKYLASDIIKSLSVRQTATRWGIGTAERYISSLAGAASEAGVSGEEWKKEMESASQRLTWADAGNEISAKSLANEMERASAGSIKDAVLEYDCVLTSRKKDRDGDILDPSGLKIDKHMPLLWQHVQHSPIGKHVGVIWQDDEYVKCRFAIADTELGRDAATLVKFGALRKSHGFKPTEFEPLEVVKGNDGKEYVRGWHVKSADVLEGSLVSIPANVDGNILQTYEKEFDGICTAFSRNELKSDLVKSYAKGLYEKRPVQVQGASLGTVNINLNVKAVDGTKGTMGAELPAEKMEKCPQCGEDRMDSTGTCAACGHVTGKSAKTLETKSGRVLSQKNYDKLTEARQAIDDVLKAATVSEEDSLAAGVDDALKSASGMVAKSLALDTKGISYSPKGSYEYIQTKLSQTASAYLKGKGVEGVSEYGYAYLYATFADRAIVCHYGNSKERCYEVGYKMVEGVPQWDGDVKEVDVEPEIIAKHLNALKGGDTSPPQEIVVSLQKMAQSLIAKAIADGGNDAEAALLSVVKTYEAWQLSRGMLQI